MWILRPNLAFKHGFVLTKALKSEFPQKNCEHNKLVIITIFRDFKWQPCCWFYCQILCSICPKGISMCVWTVKGKLFKISFIYYFSFLVLNGEKILTPTCVHTTAKFALCSITAHINIQKFFVARWHNVSDLTLNEWVRFFC